MRKRKFGNSDLETSVIGYGGWPMGRGQYGNFDDDSAIQAAKLSYEHGISLFDTAAIYGWGYGEKLMGKAIKDFRKNIVLVTKGAREWDRSNPDRNTATVADSDPIKLAKSIDDSLIRLQTDYIDLFLIHWPDKTRPFSVPMEVLEKAKKDGKIRYSGVSNFSVSMMEESLQSSDIITNQIGYHIFDRRPEEDVIPFIKKKNMGIMAYGSMAHGLLTGKWNSSKTFANDDWRQNATNFGLHSWSKENLKNNIDVVSKIQELGREYNKSITQLAISWVLANDTVSVALAGSTKPDNIKENLGGDWDMPEVLKKEIDDIVLSMGSGVGKSGMEIAT
tara:strand:+ start:104 stop:1105 length:1002 start_codon:yes stop_codon:yes gene_type:complete